MPRTASRADAGWERRSHAERTAETRSRIIAAVIESITEVGFQRTTAVRVGLGHPQKSIQAVIFKFGAESVFVDRRGLVSGGIVFVSHDALIGGARGTGHRDEPAEGIVVIYRDKAPWIGHGFHLTMRRIGKASNDVIRLTALGIELADRRTV